MMRLWYQVEVLFVFFYRVHSLPCVSGTSERVVLRSVSGGQTQSFPIPRTFFILTSKRDLIYIFFQSINRLFNNSLSLPPIDFHHLVFYLFLSPRGGSSLTSY